MTPSPPRRRVGFLAHQVAEYVVSVALIAVGLHLAGSVELLMTTSGAALIVLNLLTKSRLGAVGLLRRGVHHLLDLALAAGLLAAVVLAHHSLHAEGIAIGAGEATLLVWFERATVYRATPRAPSVRTTTDAIVAPELAADLGRVAARGAQAAADLAPRAASAAQRGARTLGIVAGLSKRAIREHHSGRDADQQAK
jgi:hypothetical protein